MNLLPQNHAEQKDRRHHIQYTMVLHKWRGIEAHPPALEPLTSATIIHSVPTNQSSYDLLGPPVPAWHPIQLLKCIANSGNSIKVVRIYESIPPPEKLLGGTDSG